MSPGWTMVASAVVSLTPLGVMAISSCGVESCPTRCPVAWLQGSALGDGVEYGWGGIAKDDAPVREVSLEWHGMELSLLTCLIVAIARSCLVV